MYKFADPFEAVMSSRGNMAAPEPSKKLDTEITSNRDALLETRTKEQYAGIPEKNKSEMWQASIEDGGDGKKILSFLVGDKTLEFALGESDAEGVSANRLPDGDRNNFGTRGEALTGKFQVHKMSADKIYGTWQAGKKSITFALDKDGDGWRIKKKGDEVPMSSVRDLVDAITIKKASDINTMLESIKSKLVDGDPVHYNTVMARHGDQPLDRFSLEPYTLPQIGLTGAAIGASLMAAKNLGQKGLSLLTGGYDDSPSLLRDMAIGAGGGAIGLGAMKLMGERDDSDELVMMNGQRVPKAAREKYKDIFKSRTAGQFERRTGIQIRNMTDREKTLEELYLKNAQEKKAAYYSVDSIKLLLANDFSLTPADRRLLMQQLQTAQYQTAGDITNIGKLKSMGLGTLAGYIAAKVLGLGTIGTIGASIIGGMLGYGGQSAPSSQFGPKQHANGYTYY